MLRCYSVKEKVDSTVMKPKSETLLALLNYSKSLEVKTVKGKKTALVMN